MIYRFGAFVLDTETFELKSGADTLATEPKVFLLLKYLIENRARVVSRDELIDAVWDGIIVSDSSLTYAIKEARRLTGDDGRTQAVIRTLPKLGFRFVAEVAEVREGGGAEEAVTEEENGPSLSGALVPAHKRWRIPIVAVFVIVVAAGVMASWQPRIEEVEAASVERMAHPLPTKPSIAVMPFGNLSGDPGQDYLSDGVTEAIITTLSKIPKLFVIDGESTSAYKDRPATVKQVAEEMGVRYVLKGSVQRSGEDMRINAQLIDALKGRYLWAERYDRPFSDIFDVQDEIASKIVIELEVKLAGGERVRALRRQTDSAEAYVRYLHAQELVSQFNEAENRQARRLLQQALDLDPDFAAAWSLMSVTYQAEARFQWSDDPARSWDRAFEFARKALAINDTDPLLHYQLANAASNKGDLDQAIPGCEKALSLEPPPLVMAHCGRIWTYVNREREALGLIRQAMRRNPSFPPVWHMVLGHAQYHLGNYDEAVTAYEAFRDRASNSVNPLGYLATAYVDAGRIGDARATFERNRELQADTSVEWWKRFIRLKDPAKKEHVLENLRIAGYPEG